MPVSCVVNGCTNRHKLGQKIHFFRFPISNADLMKKWVDAIKRKNFEPRKWTRICSFHFTEKDYQVRPGAHRPLLKPNTVPSIFSSVLQKPNNIPRKKSLPRNKDLTVLTESLEGNGHTNCNFKNVEVQTESTYTNEVILKNTIKILCQELRHQKNKTENLENLLKNLKTKGLLDNEQQTIISANFNVTMKSKEVVAGDSENEFEVDEPEAVNSDDEWAPAAATKTPGKRGRPAKNAARKKKKTTDDDDDDEEEILPKKERFSKPKTPPTPAPTRGRGRAAKAKAKKEEEPEEEPEEDDEEEEVEESEEEEDIDDEEEDIDDEEEEEEEEELNQGPNAKPAKKFTSGAFVVLKTDMLGKGNPPVWKIDGKALLQKYIPFTQDGKTLYKNTSVYSGWGSNVKEQYYSAPVSFIQQTRKEHIIEFYKDKIKKDPKVEEAAKKEMEEEEAELAAAEEDENAEEDDA